MFTHAWDSHFLHVAMRSSVSFQSSVAKASFSPPQCWDDMLEYGWIAFRGIKRQYSIYRTLTDGPLLFFER